MIDVAGGRQNHAAGAIARGQELAELGAGEARHARGRAEDGAAERLAGESRVLDEVVDDVVRAVAGGGDLLENHLALALQLVIGIERVLQDVGQDIERDADVVLEHAGVVEGGVEAGCGIELAADLLDLLGDGLGACGAPCP